jgi:hypothetical protein
VKAVMNSKINSIVISSILAFALIAGIIQATFAQNNTGMASEGGNMTGMTQGQTAEDGDDDGDDGDDGGKDDGDSEEDKDKGE